MAETEFEIQRIDTPLNTQGVEVLRAFFNERKNVATGASAGTGKTTLLTSILAEAVLKEVKAGNYSPFNDLIAVTFTVEAARQMKEKVREMLENYHRKFPIRNFEKLLSDLESNSWISTIDSMTRRLALMMAIDMKVSPEVEIIEPFEQFRIEQEILNDIEVEFVSEMAVLKNAFDENWRTVMSKGFGLLSMYVLDVKEFTKRLKHSLKDFYSCIKSDHEIDESQATPLERYNEEILNCFKTVFSVFVERLNEEFSANGFYTYDSLRKVIIHFLHSPQSKDWKKYFGMRFKYLFIDEFQDTSYAQAQLLSSLVGSKTRIMIIGDPKQSIYTWRNAEPEIFAGILAAARKNKQDVFFNQKFRYFDINRNFRSNPAIVGLTNFFFGEQNPASIFNDRNFTAHFPLPHPDVKADAPSPKDSTQPPHIHYFFTSRNRELETNYITSTITDITSSKSQTVIRDKRNGHIEWVTPELGDCAILIQRRTNWRILREQLIRKGIPYVMIADQGLYQRPEVSLLIDFLDWLGNPYEVDALLRILRSPFVGASDYFLRVLVENQFRLDQAQEKIGRLLEKSEESDALVSTQKRDYVSVSKVINLKNNLRWSREGRKAELLERILSTSHFREIMMAYSEGAQCVANLNLLCDTVQSWEEEELISYPELIARLKFYRRTSPNIQNQAVLSELESKNAVKVATIHATKGLEFPIVFLYDVDVNFDSQWRYSNCGFFGQPTYWFEGHAGQFIHLRQAEEPGSDQYRELLRRIYCRKPEGSSAFMQNMRRKYQDFVAEKWRLYYVALTRAKDHIYHGYRYRQGQARGWGNEFRKRIENFTEQENASYVERLDAPPQLQQPTKPSSSLAFKSNPAISKIGATFIPCTIDPTHIYDLLFCPRRYQYTTLKRARGMQCHEAGYSEFSSHFGDILHKMIEKYDYQTHDTAAARSYLDGLKYVRANERILLQDAIEKYSFFVRDYIRSLNPQNPQVLKEKFIQIHLKINSKPIQLRGIIDLLLIDGNSVHIYDVKTNYPLLNAKDSSKMQLRKKFMQRHHQNQLLTYRMMIERLGYNVEEPTIFSINKVSNQTVRWTAITVTETLSLLNRLKKVIPLKVTRNGLETIKDPFCDICEFKGLCMSAEAD